MPFATVAAIVGTIAAVASTAGGIASAVSGNDQPKPPQRSPASTLLFHDTATNLLNDKPPTNLLGGLVEEPNNNPLGSLGVGLLGANNGLLNKTPIGNMGNSLVNPQGGLLQRAQALQNSLNSSLGGQGTTPPYQTGVQQLGAAVTNPADDLKKKLGLGM